MIIEVEISRLLSQNLTQNQANPQDLIDVFREWKMSGEHGEDDFYEFGKDTAYIAPSVNGEPYILRHVHLVPILDSVQLAQWNKNWENHSHRTSDVLWFMCKIINGFC